VPRSITPRMAFRVIALVNRVGAVWLAVAGLYAVTGLISPAMFQVSQVLNILQVAAFLGVIAAGQTLALIAGGIDLSQAGVVTAVNILAADVMAGADANIPLALLACLLLALAVGVSNAALVVRLGVTPLIATLGMNSVLFGAALVFTGGAPHGAVAPGFQVLGIGSVAGLPAPTLVWLALTALLAWASRRTVAGRELFAAGANARAASLMGVLVARRIGLAFVGSALMAAAGGLLLTAYVGAPSLGIGTQFMLTSVAAVVIGGTALSGGVGSIAATAGGAIFVTELSSFTNIARISTGMQYVVQGAIIALSVLAYRAVGRQS
jgi:ribose transport system permease protein